MECAIESNFRENNIQHIINNTKPNTALVTKTGVEKNLFSSFFTNDFILLVVLTRYFLNLWDANTFLKLEFNLKYNLLKIIIVITEIKI